MVLTLVNIDVIIQLIAYSATIQKGGVKMVNINKLKGKIVENNLTISKLAERLGKNKSTLYRWFSENGDTITIKDANDIKNELNLTNEEAIDIFFTHNVALNANTY